MINELIPSLTRGAVIAADTYDFQLIHMIEEDCS